MVLGHKIIGSGVKKVIVTHDWFSDCSSYESMIPYLDTKDFTYIFADIRGYGLSKDIDGFYNLEEIASDILSLAQHLEIEKFYFIGHSMTGMISQFLAYKYPDMIFGSIALGGVPACGMKVDNDTYEFMKAAADNNLENAFAAANMMSGNRQSKHFVELKVQKWYSCSTNKARIKYLDMFTQTDFSKEISNTNCPLTFMVGNYEAESLNKNILEDTVMKFFPQAKLVLLENSAHYPMQEIPVYLSSLIETYMR